MKKSQLRNIIRESIRGLMTEEPALTEQQLPPVPPLADVVEVTWCCCPDYDASSNTCSPQFPYPNFPPYNGGTTLVYDTYVSWGAPPPNPWNNPSSAGNPIQVGQSFYSWDFLQSPCQFRTIMSITTSPPSWSGPNWPGVYSITELTTSMEDDCINFAPINCKKCVNDNEVWNQVPYGTTGTFPNPFTDSNSCAYLGPGWIPANQPFPIPCEPKPIDCKKCDDSGFEIWNQIPQGTPCSSLGPGWIDASQPFPFPCEPKEVKCKKCENNSPILMMAPFGTLCSSLGPGWIPYLQPFNPPCDVHQGCVDPNAINDGECCWNSDPNCVATIPNNLECCRYPSYSDIPGCLDPSASNGPGSVSYPNGQCCDDPNPNNCTPTIQMDACCEYPVRGDCAHFYAMLQSYQDDCCETCQNPNLPPTDPCYQYCHCCKDKKADSTIDRFQKLANIKNIKNKKNKENEKIPTKKNNKRIN